VKLSILAVVAGDIGAGPVGEGMLTLGIVVTLVPEPLLKLPMFCWAAAEPAKPTKDAATIALQPKITAGDLEIFSIDIQPCLIVNYRSLKRLQTIDNYHIMVIVSQLLEIKS
jgi:hypothetical protein